MQKGQKKDTYMDINTTEERHRFHIFFECLNVSDREGHGHKAVVYKSHFLPLRHSVVTETPTDTLANKPRLTKDQALCSICPHDMVAAQI